MEFKLISPAQEGFLKEIKFNHEELKTEIAAKLESYNLTVYGEEEIKSAKADRATLNKLKEAFETKRKEIKKECLAPYAAFEVKVKELIALIDEPIAVIETQVKTYEAKKKDEKKAMIVDFYTISIGDLKELLPFEKVFKATYLNSSVSMSNIESEMYAAIDKVKDDLQVIEGLQTEFKLQVKDTYVRTLDLSAALKEQKRLEEQKAKLEEYEKQQAIRREEATRQAEEQKQRQELAKQVQKAVVIEPVAELVKTVVEVVEEPTEIETLAQALCEEVITLTIDFSVTATAVQFELLKAFLKENNMKYGRVN